VVLPEILYDLDNTILSHIPGFIQGLITTLETNPNLTIELLPYRPRATDEYNDVLSQRRAQSVVDYLISRGIDPGRLTARGYGKRVPRVLVRDMTRDGFHFPAGTTLSEEYIKTLKAGPEQEAAYQLDRRSEFRVSA